MNSALIRSDWGGRIVQGKYTLLEWLGGSAWGGVYLTEIEGEERRKAAIKLIPVDAEDADVRIASWRATTALSHPHLARLLDAGRCEIGEGELLYAVTEYAEEILSEIIRERPLTPEEAGELLDGVLDALGYLHQKAFVHGHLKPSNIMAVSDQLKVSGDSLYLLGAPAIHAPGRSVYDAPEMAAGIITSAADVWSLGLILVEALTQQTPVWERAADEEPVVGTEPDVPGSMPEPFAGIARACLRRDPARRCTLSEIRARLQPARSLAELAGKAAGDAGRPARARRPVALIAAGVVILAVIAGLEVRSHLVKPRPPAGEEAGMGAGAAGPAPTAAPETQAPTGLTVKGAVAQQVLPEVLPSALESIQGTVKVRIRVTVDPGGEITDATLDSPGPSKYFARVALEAARHWRFKPAQVDGKAESSIWILRFQFRQSGTEVIAAETSP